MTYNGFISGVPEGQPRSRPRFNGPGYFIKRTAWWSAVVAWGKQKRPEKMFEGAVCVDVDLYFPRPKSTPKWKVFHTVRPDLDNVYKAILDGLTAAGWWKNDAIVCEGRVRKFYAREAIGPGAVITVSNLVEGPCLLKSET